MRPMADVRRVVVLGATGFIGRSVVSRLQRDRRLNEVLRLGRSELDLLDAGAAERLAKILDPTTALVDVSGVQKWRGDTLDAFHANIEMALCVARAVRDARPGVVVWASSGGVYGESSSNLRQREDAALAPSSWYGLAKQCGEAVLGRVRGDVGGVRLVLLRPSMVYGAGAPESFYSAAVFARQALSGRRISLWGDGRDRRDFVHVDDVAEVVFRSLHEPVEGPLNVGTGVPRSFAEAVDLLASWLGRRLDVEHRDRTRPSVDLCFDVSRLTRALPGFAPRSLETGLAEVLAAMRGATDDERKSQRCAIAP